MDVADDLLRSIDQNGIVITNGEMDTYPTLIKQRMYGIRKDVLVIDQRMLADAGYRQRCWSQARATGSVPAAGTAFVKGLLNATTRPVFLALSLDADWAKALSNELYVTGVAMRYSHQRVDNMVQLEERWKVMTKNMYAGPLTANYILPGSVLLQYYRATGQEQKASRMDARGTGHRRGYAFDQPPASTGHLRALSMALFQKPHDTMSDERLMEHIVRGDEKAFAALYDRWHGRILAYFHRMLWHDRERAQDFLQDLFAKIARKPGIYDPGRPFNTWLYSVANNMCKNEYRREEVRRNARPYLDNGNGITAAVEGDRAWTTPISATRLNTELDRLDADHRSTFVMRYHEDMAIKEIAAVFGISEGTVKSRLFYTLKKLAERMKEFDPRASHYHGTP